jgi:magnesium-transporting ATPase (P-type)
MTEHRGSDTQLEAGDWHGRDFGEAFATFASDPLTGLGEAGIAERRARSGPNRLPEAHRQGPVLRFLRQFHNVLIYVLMVAALTTGLLGHWVDTGVRRGSGS